MHFCDNLQDLFNRYNKVVLIPFIDLSGRPISVCRGIFDSGSLRTGGNYLNSECETHFWWRCNASEGFGVFHYDVNFCR